MEGITMNNDTFNYIHKRALETAGALGHLRGTVISEMLYEDIKPSKFKHLYEAFKQRWMNLIYPGLNNAPRKLVPLYNATFILFILHTWGTPLGVLPYY